MELSLRHPGTHWGGGQRWKVGTERLALRGANLSVAVWVGFLVLFGVVDDGVVIATYLEDVCKGRKFLSGAEIR